MSARERTADFFVAGGTLHPQSPSYVERPADDELFDLALAGEFCYVLTPRQMGKSSLMVRTARRLQAEGVRTAIIDLTAMGTGAVDTWYLDLLTELADALELSVNAEAWWQTRASLGQVRRFVNFLRDVVLTEITGQVVIFIDEIDATLNLDFSDDFFAAVRAMYNARASDPDFNRLTFFLLGVASPSDLISDQARTPFNIGQGIALGEFSQADAVVLQEELEAARPDQGEAIFDRIYHWTNGHPYLTQKLCLAVVESGNVRWTDERVDKLVERLFLSEEARKESNLQFVQDKILIHPHRRELLTLYKKTLQGKTIRDDGQSPIQNHLKLAGLVKAENEILRVRNEIYRRAFNLTWVREYTAINWAPILVGISVFITLLAGGAILYNTWVGIQLDSCVADFYQTSAPEERLIDLAKIFRLRGLFGPSDYDYKAIELFYGLSREEQLALFDGTNVHNVEESDLVTVVRGLYVTLADVDGTGSTTLPLETMANVLDNLGELEEAKRLRNEIGSWLKGRELAKQSQHHDALAKYNRAVDELNGENPATRYERARLLIELSEYPQALSDLDQVMAIARRASVPTPIPPSSIAVPTISPTLATASTLTPGAVITSTEHPPASVTITPIPSPVSAETPMPTATPAPASIVSAFKNTGQMMNAVRNLIYGNPGLVSLLASVSNLEYPNLREFGLLATPTFIPPAVPTRIVIPAIGVDAPVVPVSWHTLEVEGQTQAAWDVPDMYAAGWHETSAPLGVPGNTVLNGHNTTNGEVFRDLYTLEDGNAVIVYADDTPYAYTVTAVLILPEADQPLEVRQENARYILPTDDERLTLVTSHPYGSTRDRLIVIAWPLEFDYPALSRLPIPYTVQAGDTVQSIAVMFGLEPTTIMWSNPAVEDAPDLLRIDQELIILPIDGVYHTVVEEDTLESIAEKYKVDIEAIISCEYNNLEPPNHRIEEGMRLIVPDGEKPYVPKVVTAYDGPVPEGARGTGLFQWPVLGMITQGYWYGHRAIDIGAPSGSAVLAADSGFVSFAGWTDVGYGYLIVIDHANGFATYYAHLSNIYVFTGQAVELEQVIGAVGSTGWSTGPHLHFEMRYYDVQQNPRAYLP